MIILGIDPGLTGALAIETETSLSVWDMPVFHMLIGRKKRARVDAVELHCMLEVAKDMGVELAVLEAVGGRPRQSGSASFGFGYTCGLIYMACISHRIPVETTAPSVWKRAMKVPLDEDGIISRANETFPNSRQLFYGAKGGLKHDRAEAAMLARYGRRFMTHQKPRTDPELRIVYQNADMGA